MKCANKPADFIPSSFFPTGNEIPRDRSSLMRQHPDGVVLEPLNFPPTKTVLWDRTPQGPQETLQLAAQRNIRLLINEKTLWLAHRHCNQISSPFDCFLVGNISVNSRQDGIDVIIDRFDPGREITAGKDGNPKVKRKVPTTIVPGDHILPVTLVSGLSGAENSVTHSRSEFGNSLKVLHSRVSSRDPISLSYFLTFKACCHIHGGDDEVIYNLHCGGITMATCILATPVSNVPIIPTALARNLSGPLRLSEVQGSPKCGFLTLDHTRKLLLLLESDPKAYSLPLVGIWVSGVYNIHHPYIWACCVRYLHSSAVQERVFAPPNSFLLLLYSPVSATPEFWECIQHQDQSSPDLFQLYTCYENLHVEVPPNPKSSEPLLFEMLPASDGMNRMLFQQAVDSWVQEQQQHQGSAAGVGAATTSTVHPHTMPGTPQLKNKAELGHEEEAHNPLPRPSPSPHPQSKQDQFDLSIIPEVSLSLSFDESFLQDDQLTQTLEKKGRPTHQRDNIVVLKNPKQPHPKELQGSARGQENAGVMLEKDQSVSVWGAHPRVKQVLRASKPPNSPSREPLKQILSPNQMGPSHLPLQKSSAKRQQGTPRGQRFPSHGGPENLKVKAAQQKYPVRHEVSTQGSQIVQRAGAAQKMDHSHNPPVEQISSLPHSSEGRTDVGKGEGEIQRQRLSTAHVSSDTTFISFEHDNAGNRATDQILRESVSVEPVHGTHSSRVPSDANCAISLEQDVGTEMQCRSQHSQGGGELPSDASSQSNTSKEQQQKKEQQQQQQVHGKDEQFNKETHCQDLSLGRGNSWGEGTSVDSRPDPYEMIMRQQMQLAQLQSQIQLLLKQQTSTVPTPAGFLTPPRTPALPSDHDNTSYDHVTKVSVCTNTGASLLLSSPVKDSGKRSAATSPLKSSKSGRSCSRCHRISEGSPQTPPQKEATDTHSLGRSPPGSSTRSHTSEASHGNDTSLNADEDLANKTLVTDDPSQSLASSLNAVDIHSFYGTPSPQRKPGSSSSSSGMEPSFSSPVLGESASIVIEQEKNETDQITSREQVDEKTGGEIHPENLLYKNERQFYDNLLNQVKCLLDKQPEGQTDDPESAQGTTSAVEEENYSETTHKPTPEEVAIATAEELGKLLNPVLPSGTVLKSREEMQLSLNQYSASASALPSHPRINYVSLTVDETMDEVFSEADSIALKYLSDKQLTELRRQTSCHGRGVRFGGTPSTRARVLQGGSQLRTTLEREHLRNLSVVSDSDYTWNNLSFATKNYLGKYHLVPTGYTNPKNKAEKQRDGVELPCDKKVQGLERVEEAECSVEDRSHSTASQGRVAPPPTPEPTSTENSSNILDISRLKKLPKLF